MTDLVPTAFVPRLGKSGPAVWRALDGAHHAAFEDEFRVILSKVAETFDVDRLTQVVRRWWPRAVLDAYPDQSLCPTLGTRCLPGV
ncbi:MAG: DUF6247 family protein [Pseudonocardiaceae bacterium]